MALQTVMKALADPINRDILNLLKSGPLPAGEIASHFPVTASSISLHLGALKKAELVRCRREGKYLYYELNTTIFEEVLAWLSSFGKR